MATPEENRAFMLEEWKVTREQVHILLQAIWKFESAAVLGLAAFYAWYLASGGSGLSLFEWLWGNAVNRKPDWERAFLPIIPFIFSVVILHRLKIEYSILVCLARYTELAEDFLYRGNWSRDLVGWQHYLEKHRPDDIQWHVMYERYRNTFWAFTVICGGSAVYAVFTILKTISLEPH